MLLLIIWKRSWRGTRLTECVEFYWGPVSQKPSFRAFGITLCLFETACYRKSLKTHRLRYIPSRFCIVNSRIHPVYDNNRGQMHRKSRKTRHLRCISGRFCIVNPRKQVLYDKAPPRRGQLPHSTQKTPITRRGHPVKSECPRHGIRDRLRKLSYLVVHVIPQYVYSLIVTSRSPLVKLFF